MATTRRGDAWKPKGALHTPPDTFGGGIHTPTLTRVAQMGLTYSGVVDLAYEDKAPYAFEGTVKEVVFDVK